MISEARFRKILKEELSVFAKEPLQHDVLEVVETTLRTKLEELLHLARGTGKGGGESAQASKRPSVRTESMYSIHSSKSSDTVEPPKRIQSRLLHVGDRGDNLPPESTHLANLLRRTRTELNIEDNQVFYISPDPPGSPDAANIHNSHHSRLSWVSSESMQPISIPMRSSLLRRTRRHAKRGSEAKERKPSVRMADHDEVSTYRPLASACELVEENAQGSVDVGSSNSRKSRRSVLSVELFTSFREEGSIEGNTMMSDIVCSDEFNYGASFLVFLNAISIGLQTHYMATHWTDHVPLTYRVIDIAFCCMFVIEIALRLCVFGLSFFTMPGRSWNIFDCTIVFLQVAEEAVNLHLVQHSNFRARHAAVLRIARIFRLIRIFRLARVLHLFGELRLLLVSIADSFRSLCWIIVLFVLLVFVIGVYLTQVATDYKVQHISERGTTDDFRDIEMYYGSVDVTMLTLYEIITGGIHWSIVMHPLVTYVSPWLKLVFFFYSAIVLFAVLNIVTGAFVESAIRTGTEDKKKLLMYQIGLLLSQSDFDGSGTVSWEKFQTILADPKMIDFLNGLNFDIDEAGDLFDLMDVEQTGEIRHEDFVFGCMHLHGPAKSIDLASFMREYERRTSYGIMHSRLMEESMCVIIADIKRRAEANRDTDISSLTEKVSEELYKQSGVTPNPKLRSSILMTHHATDPSP